MLLVSVVVDFRVCCFLGEVEVVAGDSIGVSGVDLMVGVGTAAAAADVLFVVVVVVVVGAVDYAVAVAVVGDCPSRAPNLHLS